MRNLAWSSSAFPPLITFWATVPVVSAAAVFFAAVLRAVVFLVVVFFAVVFVAAAFFAVVFFAGALAAVFFAVVFSAAFSAVSAFTSDGFSAALTSASFTSVFVPLLVLFLPLLLFFWHLRLLHAGCCLYLLTRFITSSANAMYSFALRLLFLNSTTGSLLSWDHSMELSTRIKDSKR